MPVVRNQYNLYLRDILVEKLSKYKQLGGCDIIEIGIGHGRIGRLIAKNFNGYYGIDRDEEKVEKASVDVPKNITYKTEEKKAAPAKEKKAKKKADSPAVAPKV